MRVGLISDIHGNLLALDAVLGELDRAGVDQIVCLGDVESGPQPNETLARVRELDCPVVLGNWDNVSLHGAPEPETELEERLYATAEWWAGQLSDESRAFIETFARTLEVALDGETTMLCFHGSPKSYDDWIAATTPDEEVEEMLGEPEQRVLAGGHTHLQMLRRYSSKLIVNPGSVGLPFRLWRPGRVQIGRWAEYAIVSAENGRLAFDFRRTDFDVDAHLQIARESGMPYADWWIASWQGEDG
jgi:putative phosphoesterase